MVLTLLSLATLSIMGSYHYVLADWQLAYRASNSSHDPDQCLYETCGGNRTQAAL